MTDEESDERDDIFSGYGLPPREDTAPEDNEQLTRILEALRDPHGITLAAGRTDGIVPRSGPDTLTTRLLWFESTDRS